MVLPQSVVVLVSCEDGFGEKFWCGLGCSVDLQVVQAFSAEKLVPRVRRHHWLGLVSLESFPRNTLGQASALCHLGRYVMIGQACPIKDLRSGSTFTLRSPCGAASTTSWYSKLLYTGRNPFLVVLTQCCDEKVLSEGTHVVGDPESQSLLTAV